MTISLASISLAPAALAPTAAPALQAGYGASLGDIGAFERALAGVGAPAGAVAPPGQAMQALFRPLEFINAEAKSLQVQANAASAEGRAMTPSELLTLSVKCQEFMFHCQLTSNAANRTSDGLQQLFRQQA